MASEDVLQLTQERCTGFHPRRVMRSPRASTAANPTEREAEESEAVPTGQVDGLTLLLVDRDLEVGEFLPEASVHGREQPVMPAVGIHQDHEIIGEARILEVCVLPVPRDLLGALEHPVHLVEVEVAEQG